MPDDVAIKVEHVKKSFKLPHENAGSLKNMIVGYGKRKKGYEIQNVLKDVSFDIKKGEFFGIVGRNGSGKSTLLKLLAGIYTPTGGSIVVNGKLTPFIELGVGFNQELTGRENVFLNGSLLGFNRTEMAAMYEDIVEFAELERFMDQKLKNYSSGMQVRLAFSIAIRANTPILLLDEVLAVGDEAFQKKCNDFFNDMKKDSNRTIVLVTHSMDSVRRYCDRAMLLEDGKVVTVGDPNEVADAYSKQFIKDTSTSKKETNRYGTGEIVFENITHKLTKEWFYLEFDIVNKTAKNFNTITMGFDFCLNGEIIMGYDTRYMDEYKSGIKLAAHAKEHYTLKFKNNLGKHTYSFNVNVRTDLGANTTDYITSAFQFDSNNVRVHEVFKVLSRPEITVTDTKK